MWRARDQPLASTVVDRTMESRLSARGTYQDPAMGQRIEPGARLGDRY